MMKREGVLCIVLVAFAAESSHPGYVEPKVHLVKPAASCSKRVGRGLMASLPRIPFFQVERNPADCGGFSNSAPLQSVSGPQKDGNGIAPPHRVPGGRSMSLCAILQSNSHSGIHNVFSSPLSSLAPKRCSPPQRSAESATILNAPGARLWHLSLHLRGGGRPTKIVEKAKAQDLALKSIKKVRKVRYKAGTKGYVPFAGPRLYTVGGRSTKNDLGTVQAFDAKTEKWELCTAGVPTRRAAFPAVGLFGRVYVLGGTQGFTPLASVEVMSPHSKEAGWRQETTMPFPRRLFDACALDGKIYVVGGAGPAVFCNRTANDASYRSVMRYDVLDKTWSNVTSLPAERRHHAVASLGGRIYVVGGWRGNVGLLDMGDNLDEVCSWQPGEEEWRVEPALPTRRRSLQAVALNGRIYAIGGVDEGIQLDTVESFSPEEV
jgi:hypothetical protein